MGDDLKGKTIGALKWSMLDRFGQQSVQFIIGMVLARILSPDDFGLMGMVLIFSSLSFVLVESGFGQALIRKIDAGELEYNSVYYTNVVIAVILYFSMFFLAPQIAVFFNEPEIVLICRVIFISLLFNALYLVPLAKLGKVLDYKTIAVVNSVSTIVSGVAGILSAIVFRNVWALIVQQLTYHFVRMIMFYIKVKWRPSKMFSLAVIKGFIPFTSGVLTTAILNVLFNNVFVIILGKFYPRSEVGYYNQGNKLNETVSFSIQSVLLASTFSVFSQIQNDTDRLRRIFREFSNKISLITLPLLLALVASASQFVVIVWSDVYEPSVIYFQLMCLSTLFAPLNSLNVSVLNARGLSRTTLMIESIKKLLILLSILITFNYGVKTMMIGYIISSYIAYLVSLFYVRREIGYYYKYQKDDMFKNVVLSLVIFVAVYSVNYIEANVYVKFIIQIVVGLSLYLLFLRLFYKNFLLKLSKYLKIKKFSF